MLNNNDYIILKGVHKQFANGESTVLALQDISLTIKKGEFVAIVGPSGSGKTTLMNTIGCLDEISSGNIFFYGVDVSSLNVEGIAKLRNKYIGFIFQKYNLLNYLTAKENVSLPAQYTQKNYSGRNVRAEKLLDTVGLCDRIDFKPNQLSGGQQQRVSIARALMNDAEVILADEPTGALDSVTGSQVMDIFRELNNRGKTIILVTHDKEIAAQASRVISMNDGKIIQDEKSIYTENFMKKCSRDVENDPLNTLSGIFEAFRTAFRALNGHRMRAFLSILGVIIGVYAVLMSVAISEGAHHRIMTEMNFLDNNTIEIRPGASWKSMPEPGSDLLSKKDIDTLNEVLPGSHISPVMTSSTTAIFADGEMTIMLTGVSKDNLENKPILAGRFFDEDNQSNSDAVVVIESRLAETLYASSEDAIGKYLNITGYPFEIIGVVKDASTVSEMAVLKAWAPWTSYINRITGTTSYEVIQVRAEDQNELEAMKITISQVLESSRGKKDFFIVTNESVAEMIANVSTSMKFLTIAISAISLLVGGVGVMNIMFVSVTERIHEIGIRLSVGANPADIKRQFLIESVFICFIGGVIGVALTVLTNLMLPFMTNQFEMILNISPIILACAFSCIIGLIFGYMPANKASSYTPAKALGYK